MILREPIEDNSQGEWIMEILKILLDSVYFPIGDKFFQI